MGGCLWRRWLATARDELTVAVLDGKLYAVGGTNLNDGSLSSAERYDPPTNVWEAVAPMAEARAYHDMTVLEGKLARSMLWAASAAAPSARWSSTTRRWTCVGGGGADGAEARHIHKHMITLWRCWTANCTL